MKHLNRKIISALLILVISLIAFIGFSKAGILFSTNSGDIITVSTTKKTFDPNNYVAAIQPVVNENKIKEEISTTTISTTINATLSEKKVSTTTKNITTTTKSSWQGEVLSKSKGVVNGPSGKETYYNLNMAKIVNIMRNLGYSEEEYPYWVRDDGVKMLGNYVMVAASYDIRPRGTILESSLGIAIVCDTGGFAKINQTQIDIAVTWK